MAKESNEKKWVMIPVSPEFKNWLKGQLIKRDDTYELLLKRLIKFKEPKKAKG